MTLSTILIVWMDDGTEKTYPNVTASVLDGVLHVHQYTGVTGTHVDEWHFPISNIRYWKPLPHTQVVQ